MMKNFAQSTSKMYKVFRQLLFVPLNSFSKTTVNNKNISTINRFGFGIETKSSAYKNL